jgi:uncharacterized phiE125 gp8 family phage protein
MTITRVHHQAGTAPLTLEEIKTWCRVDNSEEDFLLTGLADTARDTIEQQTGRAIVPQTVTVLLDNVPASRRIPLPRLPVSVQPSLSLKVYQANGSQIEATGFVVGEYVYASGSNWPAGDMLEITYRAGYATVPGNLATAMLLLIDHWYTNRSAVAVGTIATELPFAVRTLIAPYRVHYHAPA